jgi:hypothetical protein
VTTTIDWGDGTNSAGTVAGTESTSYVINSLYTVSGSHTYATDGTYQASVTAATASSSATANFTIVVDSAPQLVANLGTTIGGMGLDHGLANDLQNRLNDVSKKLASHNPADACNALDDFLQQVIDDAGNNKPKLTVAQAESIVAAANQIETVRSCLPAVSPKPGAEQDVLALIGTVDGMGLDNGFSNGLESDIANIGGNVVGGPDACKPLGNLATKIGANIGKKNGLTAAQAATLNTAIAQIRSELGC